MRRHTLAALCGLLLSCAALAFTPNASAQLPSKEALHRGTVSIITGQHSYLSARLASDLSAVLDEGDNLRVLAVSGRGALSDIIDILYLRGIDLAIVPTDVVDYAKTNNLFPIMTQKLRYVARLYSKAAHLVANKEIKNINELSGKKINVISRYHGAFITAKNIFGAYDIDYKPVFIDERAALEQVRRGEIAATLIMSGIPNPLLSEVSRDPTLRFVQIPFTDALPKAYFPITLSGEDYPAFVPAGGSVPSIATSSTMLVFDFEGQSNRRAKITRFVDAFLSRLPDLQKAPRHPRWQDVRLTVAVPGMKRYRPVEEWLKNNDPPEVAALRAPKKGRRSVEDLFKAFIASESATGGAAELLRLEKPELFRRFKAWLRKRQGPSAVPKPQPAVAPAAKPSLRKIFRTFIDEEVRRVGKENVLALSKSELYQRFLQWRRRTSQ